MVRLLKLWLRRVFSKDIKKIIKGNLKSLMALDQDLYYIRHDICEQCSQRGHYASIGEICEVCGCLLQAKLRVKDEKCDLNKWDAVKN